MEYDYSKAEDLQNYTIQTPLETVKAGRGICTDYTILTAALLLDLGVNPVYVLDIEFENKEIGHATASVKIGDEYFALDQHLPPIHLGAYYYKWLKEGSRISEITVYEVLKRDVLEVKVVETLNGSQLENMLYKVGDEDLEAIRKAISDELVAEKSWLREDTRLKEIAENELECKLRGKVCPTQYLPYGFSEGIILTVYEPAYYYHPALLGKFAEMVVREFENVDKYDSFYVAVGIREYEFNSTTLPTITVVGCFAR